MTCRDIDGLISCCPSGAPTPPEMAAHIAGCERCRRLIGAMGQTLDMAPPSPEQLRQIEHGILLDLKPVKPLPPAGVLWLAFAFALALVASLGAVVLGTAGWHALGMPTRIAVFTVLALSAGLLAFSAERQMVPGSSLQPAACWLVAAVLGVIIAICAVFFQPLQEPAFVSTGLVCLKTGVVCAVPAAWLLWLLLRRGAILNPVPAGAVAGAMAGLSGLTVLEIHCPNLNRHHILVWHLGAVLVSIAAGVALGVAAEYWGRKALRSP